MKKAKINSGKKVLVLDIDDTLGFPSPYRNIPGETMQVSDLESMPKASIWDDGMLTWINCLAANKKTRTYYVTGRHDKWKTITESWLTQNGFPRGTLKMLNYRSFNQYISEKVETIFALVKDASSLVMIDDNKEILFKVREKISTGYPDLRVYQFIVIDGSSIESIK